MTKTDKKQKNGPSANEANRVPELFSPLMSVLFTLLFTPMFGAFLQGLNWRELGDDELAARNMGWVKWTFITFAVYTFSEPFIRDTFFGRYLMIALFIGFWVSWTFSLGIKQIKYVRDNVPVYTKKFMGRAIMIGAFGWVAYTAVALTLVLMLHVTGIDPLPADAPILQQEVPAQGQSSNK
jgi:magnesium-transporting ATPase (P-type)